MYDAVVDEYRDIPMGLFMVRGENVALLGELHEGNCGLVAHASNAAIKGEAEAQTQQKKRWGCT